VDSSAIRNDCSVCKGYRPPESKRFNLYGLHCTTCHEVTHGACEECGTCLPDGHRYDRRYCSSSCRATAHKARQLLVLARSVWEAEHPEEAALQAKEQEEWLAAASAVMGALDSRSENRKSKDRQQREARLRAAECSDCQQPLDVVYRRHNGTHEQETGTPGAFVVPVCEACRCSRHTYHRLWLCDRCRPGRSTWDWTTRTHNRSWSCPDAGPDHVGTYCTDCHPHGWRDPAPCEGCARLVVNHDSVRPGYRRGVMLDGTDDDVAWIVDGDHYREIPADSIIRVFCSELCRRQVFRAEQKAKREPVADKRCDSCKAPFRPARADSRYCSNACRQKAYRDRTPAKTGTS